MVTADPKRVQRAIKAYWGIANTDGLYLRDMELALDASGYPADLARANALLRRFATCCGSGLDMDVLDDLYDYLDQQEQV